MKSEYTPSMATSRFPHPEILTPEQAIDCVLARLRKRIQVLTDVRLDDYRIAVAELRNVEDLLKRCRGYVAEVSSKLR